MDATVFLATVIGWYLVIFSLFLLTRTEQAKLIMSDVMAHRGLFFILAVFTLILGLLMVVSHNVWIWDWPLFVTLFSWLLLITAVVRIFWTDTMRTKGTAFVNHPAKLRVTAIILLILGLYALYHVYFMH